MVYLLKLRGYLVSWWLIIDSKETKNKITILLTDSLELIFCLSCKNETK